MATKKAASSAKKSTTKKPTAKKQSITNVTTVKAVESAPSTVKAASTSNRSVRFSLSRAPLVAALVAEFVGTFILAAAFVAGQGQPIIALFALTGIVLALGAASGAYVNPATTLAAWVTKRMTGMRAVAYLVAQILGAMLALVVLNAFVSAAPTPDATSPFAMGAANELFAAATLPEGKEWYIFFAEALGALIFGAAMASATRQARDRTASAFTAGFGFFLALLVAGSAAAYLSGTAIVNPALAVTMQAIDISNLWSLSVYVLGPILGAVLGFLLFDTINNAEEKELKARM